MGTLKDLAVISRGVDVTHIHRMCGVGLDLLEGREAADASRHRSASLEGEDLDAADLVITATRAERAEIARMRPAMRDRTFTLQEAVALGAARALAPEPFAVDASGVAPLREYAAVIHSRRGSVALETQERPKVLLRRATGDPQDIVDVHHARPKPHLETLKRVRSSVFQLHLQIGAFLPARAV